MTTTRRTPAVSAKRAIEANERMSPGWPTLLSSSSLLLAAAFGLLWCLCYAAGAVISYGMSTLDYDARHLCVLTGLLGTSYASIGFGIAIRLMLAFVAMTLGVITFERSHDFIVDRLARKDKVNGPSWAVSMTGFFAIGGTMLLVIGMGVFAFLTIRPAIEWAGTYAGIAVLGGISASVLGGRAFGLVQLVAGVVALTCTWFANLF